MFTTHGRWLVLMIIALFLSGIVGCSQAQPPTAPPGPEPDPGAAHQHGHEHDEDLVEWSGTYTLEAGTYSLVFRESSHDPSIMVAFLDGTDYLEAGDDLVAHHTALHLMEAVPPLTAPDMRLEVVDRACYNLTLEPQGTTYELYVPASGEYILFTEHFAWEFDMQITGPDGTTVEPYNVREYTEPHAH